MEGHLETNGPDMVLCFFDKDKDIRKERPVSQ